MFEELSGGLVAAVFAPLGFQHGPFYLVGLPAEFPDGVFGFFSGQVRDDEFYCDRWLCSSQGFDHGPED